MVLSTMTLTSLSDPNYLKPPNCVNFGSPFPSLERIQLKIVVYIDRDMN